MLQEKYLPVYHFDETHAIRIKASTEKIYPVIETLDFSRSVIIRLLFALRGMPASMMNTRGLEEHRFYTLERVLNEEIIIGLIGQFWKSSGNLQVFKPEEFTAFSTPGFAKATWSFRLVPEATGLTKVETITRIACTDEKSIRRFSRYWFVIRPFSGLIRMEMLRAMKRKLEQLNGV